MNENFAILGVITGWYEFGGHTGLIVGFVMGHLKWLNDMMKTIYLNGILVNQGYNKMITFSQSV